MFRENTIQLWIDLTVLHTSYEDTEIAISLPHSKRGTPILVQGFEQIATSQSLKSNAKDWRKAILADSCASILEVLAG
jgi:hypothetical protein